MFVIYTDLQKLFSMYWFFLLKIKDKIEFGATVKSVTKHHIGKDSQRDFK